MFRKLLVLGTAGIVAALMALPAWAWHGGLGFGFRGIGMGLWGAAPPGWWGPIAAMGWPWGLFGSAGCW